MPVSRMWQFVFAGNRGRLGLLPAADDRLWQLRAANKVTTGMLGPARVDIWTQGGTSISYALSPLSILMPFINHLYTTNVTFVIQHSQGFVNCLFSHQLWAGTSLTTGTQVSCSLQNAVTWYTSFQNRSFKAFFFFRSFFLSRNKSRCVRTPMIFGKPWTWQMLTNSRVSIS